MKMMHPALGSESTREVTARQYELAWKDSGWVIVDDYQDLEIVDYADIDQSKEEE